MDLMAPNPLIMGTGFAYLGMLIVVLIVAQLKNSRAANGPLLWAKLNGPLVSIILGEAWAMIMYAVPVLRTSPALDDYFVAGIWIAGGSGLVAAIWKDARDGSITTATPEGVQAMRAKNDSKGGIGA